MIQKTRGIGFKSHRGKFPFLSLECFKEYLYIFSKKKSVCFVLITVVNVWHFHSAQHVGQATFMHYAGKPLLYYLCSVCFWINNPYVLFILYYGNVKYSSIFALHVFPILGLFHMVCECPLWCDIVLLVCGNLLTSWAVCLMGSLHFPIWLQASMVLIF